MGERMESNADTEDRQRTDYFRLLLCAWGRGGTVVKVLRYKSEGRWFDSRLCHWNFSLT